MTATEGRIKPQSISDDVARVVAQLRQALRPIEPPYGESSGGPDGWSPEPDEIAEWEMTFREHATPANVSTLLAALALAQQERETALAELEQSAGLALAAIEIGSKLTAERDTARQAYADACKCLGAANGERDAMHQERDELRALLQAVWDDVSSIDTDACLSPEVGRRLKAVLTPKATQP